MRILGMRGRRLESVEKAKKELGLTLLGELPLPSAGAAKLEAGYTHLFQETLLRVTQGELHRTTLAITSTREREGRTSVAANLALAAARQGRSVLLVDTNVHDSLLSQIFCKEASPSLPGLLDLLAMTVTSPSEVLLETRVPRLRLLPVGDVARHDAAALFSSSRLERFVRNHAPRLADIVIFDTPAVLSKEPGRQVLSHVDGTVFVVGLGEIEASSARKALEYLESRQVRVLGGAFLSLGRFSPVQTVPLPEVTLKKPVKDTNIVERVSQETPEEKIHIMSLVPSVTVPLALENEADRMSMNVAAAQKQDDDGPNTTPTSGFGVEDLEAVLQGWRRRDSVPTEGTEQPIATGSVPISLPPLFNISEESSASEELAALAPEPINQEGVTLVSIPFLSIATTSEASADEEATEPPLLTLVEQIADPVVAEIEEKAVSDVLVAVPDVVSEPIVEEKVIVSEVPAPEPVVVPVVAETPRVPEWVAPAPVVVAPVPVAAAPTPQPVAAPAWPSMPPVMVPAPTFASMTPAPTPPAPVMAPLSPVSVPPAASTAPTTNRLALDMQIDMFQTGPGEMTMRAVTSNAAVAGVPPVSLELGMAMNAMRGMRAITPSSTGGSDQPRIALEAVATDAPDATRMRLIVGSTHEPALEIVVHNGAGISVRTGTGMDQPAVKVDSQNLPDGGTITRATLHPSRGGQELVLELRREAVNDGFTDARWRNRLSLFA